ncbi:hypothetical protein BC940DRAFT_121702 [Gongronella butleri]|nr:hypothetical protein BC940DRAFT_121702 [Gongronella butleri]
MAPSSYQKSERTPAPRNNKPPRAARPSSTKKPSTPSSKPVSNQASWGYQSSSASFGAGSKMTASADIGGSWAAIASTKPANEPAAADWAATTTSSSTAAADSWGEPSWNTPATAEQPLEEPSATSSSSALLDDADKPKSWASLLKSAAKPEVEKPIETNTIELPTEEPVVAAAVDEWAAPIEQPTNAWGAASFEAPVEEEKKAAGRRLKQEDPVVITNNSPAPAAYQQQQQQPAPAAQPQQQVPPQQQQPQQQQPQQPFGMDHLTSAYSSYQHPSGMSGFGMNPMGNVPDYGIYGGDAQRAAAAAAMGYYDPSAFGNHSPAASNASAYPSRDKFGQDIAPGQSGQNQGMHGQVYPGMPYYPYYYMGHYNAAYGQSMYGQPMMNKTMYPNMYQQQPPQPPQQQQQPPQQQQQQQQPQQQAQQAASVNKNAQSYNNGASASPYALHSQLYNQQSGYDDLHSRCSRTSSILSNSTGTNKKQTSWAKFWFKSFLKHSIPLL